MWLYIKGDALIGGNHGKLREISGKFGKTTNANCSRFEGPDLARKGFILPCWGKIPGLKEEKNDAIVVCFYRAKTTNKCWHTCFVQTGGFWLVWYVKFPPLVFCISCTRLATFSTHWESELPAVSPEWHGVFQRRKSSNKIVSPKDWSFPRKLRNEAKTILTATPCFHNWMPKAIIPSRLGPAIKI